MSLDFIHDRSSHLTISDKTFYTELYSVTTIDESSLHKGDVVLVRLSSGSYSLCMVASDVPQVGANGVRLVEYIPHNFVRESTEVDYTYLEKVLYKGITEVECIFRTDNQYFLAEGICSELKSFEYLHNTYGLTYKPTVPVNLFSVSYSTEPSYSSVTEGGYYVISAATWFATLSDLHIGGYTLVSSVPATVYAISGGIPRTVPFNDNDQDGLHAYWFDLEESSWIHKSLLSTVGYQDTSPSEVVSGINCVPYVIGTLLGSSAVISYNTPEVINSLSDFETKYGSLSTLSGTLTTFLKQWYASRLSNKKCVINILQEVDLSATLGESILSLQDMQSALNKFTELKSSSGVTQGIVPVYDITEYEIPSGFILCEVNDIHEDTYDCLVHSVPIPSLSGVCVYYLPLDETENKWMDEAKLNSKGYYIVSLV